MRAQTAIGARGFLDDGVTLFIAFIEGSDLRPTADVVPADREGNDSDVAGAFHDAGINRDAGGQAWPGGVHDPLNFGRHAALRLRCYGADLVQHIGDGGRPAANLLQNAIYPPDEYSSVPDVIACLEILFGARARWLFDKLLDHMCAQAILRGQWRAIADVAITRLRIGWGDAQRHQMALLRDFFGEREGAAKRGDIGDGVIGGE